MDLGTARRSNVVGIEPRDEAQQRERVRLGWTEEMGVIAMQDANVSERTGLYHFVV